MPAPRNLLLTLLAMLGFAGNSLLCRLALKEGALDAAATFTSLRLLFGALTLWLLVRLGQAVWPATGFRHWPCSCMPRHSPSPTCAWIREPARCCCSVQSRSAWSWRAGGGVSV